MVYLDAKAFYRDMQKVRTRMSENNFRLSFVIRLGKLDFDQGDFLTALIFLSCRYSCKL